MQPSPTARTRRRAVIGLAILLIATVFAPAQSASAAPAIAAAPTSPGGSAESSFFTLLNASRSAGGLPALQYDAPLSNTARTWSANMASRNQLYHDPNLLTIVANLEPQWRSGAENVGFGYDVQQLHDAFMNSPAHRASIMSTRFNRTGVGVVYDGTKIWVTVRFIQGPGLTAAAAPPPTPTGVRTVLTGDFDGDGFDDLLAYGPGAEADELWFGRAGRTMRKVAVNIKGQYLPVAGDFDGDGRTEILWYAPGPATDSLWKWNGSGWSSTTKAINGRYMSRAGDFDADGIDDILWYAPGDALDYRWYGNRNGTFTSVPAWATGSFIPVVGDFDGNGGDDVFWYARGSAGDAIWWSTRQRGDQRLVSVTAGGSHTPFAGDFDGNGIDDIFFYTPGTAADSIWYNSLGAFGGRRVSTPVNGTYVPGVGDFDANGLDDVLWYSPAGGAANDPLWWGVSGLLSTIGRILGNLLPG